MEYCGRVARAPSLLQTTIIVIVLAVLSPIARAAEVEFEAGFNLFSYPVAVPEGLNCLDLQSALQAESVARLDTTSGAVQTCAVDNTFDILNGEGYLVEMAVAATRSFDGPNSCPTISLSAGVNLIGVPTPKQGLSCFSILDSVEGSEAIQTIERFALANASFGSCQRAAPAAPATGLDFAILPGQGYIVSVTAGTPNLELELTDDALCQGCPLPLIDSVLPLSGTPGSVVTVTGENLDCGDLALTFGDVSAPILSRTATTLTTIIPLGAANGALTLVGAGGSVTVPPELTVAILPAREFNLTIPNTFNSLVRGETFSLLVEATGGAEFVDLINLQLGSLPAGVAATVVPATITAGQLAVVRFSVAPDAALQTFTFVVTGNSTVATQSISRMATSELQVVAGGQTVVQGKFQFANGQPMAGILLSIDSDSTTTDAAGNFRFVGPPAGLQTLSIDTTPVNPALPIYAVDINIADAQFTQLPPFIHHPLPPAEAFTPLVQAGPTDQVFESMDAPGAMITLPAGETITGWDGVPKEQLAIVRRDPDKLPVPPPPGQTNSVYQPMFGTPMGGIPSTVLPVTTPNDLGMAPGEVGDIWYYDAAPIPGAPGEWVYGGTARVSQDGSSVVSDPGSGIGRFCGVCGLWCIVKRQFAQLNLNFDGPFGGDPVSLSLGQMITQKTDLTVAGRMDGVVSRIHNPLDPFGGTAGVQLGLGSGWTLSVDQVIQEQTNSLIRLVMPGNARYDFTLQSDGTYVNSRHQRFAGAVLSRVAAGLQLRYRDGSKVLFRESTILGLSDVSFAVQFSDANDNQVNVYRDNLDRVLRIVEPSGRSLQFNYGANGLIDSVVDPIGRSVSYAYTGNRLTTVTDVGGGTTTYTYNNAGGIVSITDAKGVVWLQNAYDEVTGRLVTQTQADGGQWQFEYLRPCAPGETPHPLRDECSLSNAEDIPTSAVVTDPMGHQTITGFGSSGGYVNEYIDALGQRTLAVRDTAGRVVSVSDPLGRVRSIEYDNLGNVTRFIDVAGVATDFEYELAFNRLISITDALGNETRYTYDQRGNMVSATDPLGATAQLEYDELGLPVAFTDALLQTSRYGYDDRGNLVSLEDPLGNRMHFGYDPVARLTDVTDALGRPLRVAYDEFDRLTEIVDALGRVTQFTYDANGLLLSITDPSDSTTSFAYNQMEQLVSRTDVSGVSETFEYDLNGNLVRHTDRRGQIASYTYDPRNQPMQVQYADALVEYAFDAVGRLMEVRDSAGGDTVFSYDGRDRLIEVVTENGSVSYDYDVLHRRTSMSYADEIVLFSYDAASRLTAVSRGGQNTSFEYDALGRRTRLVQSNGAVTRYGYDARSLLTELSYEDSGGAPLGEINYAYNAMGHRTMVSGSLASVGLPGAVADTSFLPGDRLATMGGQTLEYDENGNLLSIDSAAGLTSLTWDARNRLVALVNPEQSATYRYDGLGRRLAQTSAGEEIRYLYDGDHVVQEQSPQMPKAVLRSLFQDEVLAYDDANYPLLDALGSTVAEVSANGAVRGTVAYTPFGVTQEQGELSGSNRYTGRQLDASGLYYYRARYFAPELKRFISEDPIGLNGGDTNLFAYVGSNPVNYRDPSGLGREDRVYDYSILAYPDAPSLEPPRDVVKEAEEAAKLAGTTTTWIDNILSIYNPTSSAKPAIGAADTILTVGPTVVNAVAGRHGEALRSYVRASGSVIGGGFAGGLCVSSGYGAVAVVGCSTVGSTVGGKVADLGIGAFDLGTDAIGYTILGGYHAIEWAKSLRAPKLPKIFRRPPRGDEPGSGRK